MPLLEVNGTRLMVEESGSGEPLVLVHGSWDDHQAWEWVVANLARTFRVVAYDRRGHSDSEEGSGTGTRRDDEDDLAALIETLDLGPAHVVCNSFGGCVALGMATRRPELLRSLCAHEPPLLGVVPDHPVVRQTREGVRPVLQLIDEDRREEAAEHFVERVALGPGIWPMMRARERETMIRNAHTFAAEMRDPGGVTVDLDALSGLHAPVLFTQGDQSPPFYAAVIARLAEAIDGAEVRTFTGAGHVPHITHSAEYVGAVTAFARAAAGSVR